MREKLYFAKLRPEAVIPSKRDEDAGYDIYACFDEDYLLLAPLETRRIPPGLMSAFSPEYNLQLQERGSTGTKDNNLFIFYRYTVDLKIFNKSNTICNVSCDHTIIIYKCVTCSDDLCCRRKFVN